MTHVDAKAKMRGPIKLLKARLLERGSDSNIAALVSIDITVVVAFAIAIVVIVMGEFCGDCSCTRCLRTYSRRE